MKLLFFDLETTGTNPARHGIHQISGIVEIDGVEQERFDFKVRPNPKAEILDEALAVGGVTREEIDAYPLMEEVYGKLVALLARYVNKYNKTDKFFLVGYNNASFDNQFLRGLLPTKRRQLLRLVVLVELRRRYGAGVAVPARRATTDAELQALDRGRAARRIGLGGQAPRRTLRRRPHARRLPHNDRRVR